MSPTSYLPAVCLSVSHPLVGCILCLASSKSRQHSQRYANFSPSPHRCSTSSRICLQYDPLHASYESFNESDYPQDEDWMLDESAIFHLVYKSRCMEEDQVPHCTPSLHRKLMLLAFKSVQHTINLDVLRSKWWHLRNQDIPNLQDEFQRVFPLQMQTPTQSSLCVYLTFIRTRWAGQNT